MTLLMKKLDDLSDVVQEEEDAADFSHVAEAPQGTVVSQVRLNQPQMLVNLY